MTAFMFIMKQTDHRISLLRRGYYRDEQHKSSFLMLPNSTKAELLAEQKEQDKKNQEKLESAKAYNAQRQEIRAKKGRAYTASSSPVMPHQEDHLNKKPELTIGSMDSQLALLWKTGQLPGQAAEILTALASV